jgi:hypothetical protein
LIGVASDGVVRCLPPLFGDTAFSDSSCQQEIDYMTTEGDCGDMPPPTHVVIQNAACPVSYSPRKVGARYTGPLFRNINGVCEEFDDGGPVYLATTNVPPDTFAAGTIKTGP